MGASMFIAFISVTALDWALSAGLLAVRAPAFYYSCLHRASPLHMLLISNMSLRTAAFLGERMGRLVLTGLTWRSAPASRSQCLSSSSLRWMSSWNKPWATSGKCRNSRTTEQQISPAFPVGIPLRSQRVYVLGLKLHTMPMIPSAKACLRQLWLHGACPKCFNQRSSCSIWNPHKTTCTLLVILDPP